MILTFTVAIHYVTALFEDVWVNSEVAILQSSQSNDSVRPFDPCLHSRVCVEFFHELHCQNTE